MSWRRILFVMDRPSQIGPRLLRKLADLARGCDAELELYQPAFEWGMHKGGIGSVASDIETRETLERRHGELDGVIQALRAAGVRVRGGVSCEKATCANIVEHALASQPDLIIVSSRRHSAIARRVLWQTDFELIEKCPSPLLLMKTEKAYLDPCIIAAVDPMHAHDKPSRLDEVIVAAAAAMADAVGGSLHICHALGSEEQAEAQRRVDDLARRVTVREKRVHVAPGDPAEMIPNLVNALQADVVVMGAVSRSALERAVIGHTAERVLDALDCDVLVVKPPGFHA